MSTNTRYIKVKEPYYNQDNEGRGQKGSMITTINPKGCYLIASEQNREPIQDSPEASLFEITADSQTLYLPSTRQYFSPKGTNVENAFFIIATQGTKINSSISMRFKTVIFEG